MEPHSGATTQTLNTEQLQTLCQRVSDLKLVLELLRNIPTVSDSTLTEYLDLMVAEHAGLRATNKSRLIVSV